MAEAEVNMFVDVSEVIEYIVKRYGSVDAMVAAMSVPTWPGWAVDRAEYDAHEIERLQVKRDLASAQREITDLRQYLQVARRERDTALARLGTKGKVK